MDNLSNIQIITTDIAEEQYMETENIKHVIIKPNITHIGAYAFANCLSLETVEISAPINKLGTVDSDTFSVKSEGYIFFGCTSLKSVLLPPTLKEIGGAVFENCSSLESIIIPEGVRYIGRDTFRGCTSLRSVVIPESVTYIGSGAFAGCVSLKEISIVGANSIGHSAFEGCISLERIILSKNIAITSIEGHSFADCKSLKAIVTSGICSCSRPSTSNCFNNCNPQIEIGWKNIKKQNGLILKSKTLEGKDWSTIESVLDCKSILIPESIKTLGASDYEATGSWNNPFNHFCDCASLEEIIIPESIIDVSSSSFINCNSLQKVIFLGSTTQISSIAFDNCNVLKSIIVPCGSKKFYCEQLQYSNLMDKVVEI